MAAKAPEISVITVVLNGATVLEATLRSVFEQDRSLYEYIVVDGGSTDMTISALQKYDACIDRWISEPDRGIYDAMNKGLSMARGEWAYFLNCGDTLIGPDVLSEASQQLRKCKTNILAGSVLAHIDGKTTTVFPLRGHQTKTARALFASRFCHQALFVRRTEYIRAGCFDLRYPHFADFDICWRIIAESGGFHSTDLMIANFDLRGVSSDFRRSVQLYREAERLFRSVGEARSSIGYVVGYCRAVAFRYKMSQLTAAK
jgi:glycosyltransferase involved in cell wall biosynthesis